ncbi:MAG TPA: class I SAM-dependent methyltransferase [Actinomycetota bacterium]|nr:class I SAM-dependent methyltransferase [Actinomycetota bacterium]
MGPLSGPVAAVTGPPLTVVDRAIRAWRIRVAARYVRRGSRVLDVGCHDGALFRALDGRISSGLGVDPDLEGDTSIGPYTFTRASFPGDPPIEGVFDAITMLAVLEHMEPSALEAVHRTCLRLLAPGGSVVITVPSPQVDRILHWLQRARLIAGVALHQHHGFDPALVPATLDRPPLRLISRRRFEFGLNNLFVFERT